jgi:hypothetical protein
MEMQELSEDVILRRLRNTNIPTIVVEGKDDTLLLSWILATSNGGTENIFLCGSCKLLENIYKEVSNNLAMYPLVKLFVADQDMYIFTGIPQKFEGIFHTKGYSIENDLYADAEQFIDNLLIFPDILEKKKTIIANVSKWFAFEVESYLNKLQLNERVDSKFKDCKLLNERDFSQSTLDFTPEFFKKRSFTTPRAETVNDLLQNYFLKLRGHTLFEIIGLLLKLRKVNDTKVPKIEDGKLKKVEIANPFFQQEQILNICFARAIENENGFVSRIVVKVKESLVA